MVAALIPCRTQRKLDRVRILVPLRTESLAVLLSEPGLATSRRWTIAWKLASMPLLTAQRSRLSEARISLSEPGRP